MDDQLLTFVTDGGRLDTALAQASGMTRSRVAGLIAAGQCRVDGRVERKAGAKPPAGLTAELTVPAPKSAELQPQDLPLTILYQDEALAVVVKPCGMVVHPAAGHADQTLVNALLWHLDSLGGIGGEERPGIVHRLDKDTSGRLLIAKNDAAQAALSAQLQARAMEKHYLALAEGIWPDTEGRVEAAIARSKTDRKRMAVDPAGREAVTLWRLLERGRGCSLLDVHILTGRTHQIRVHLKYIGHPVCGDPVYGRSRGLAVPRLMLHAHTLAFTHPVTGERLRFTAPPDGDFLRGLRAGGIAWREEPEPDSSKQGG